MSVPAGEPPLPSSQEELAAELELAVPSQFVRAYYSTWQKQPEGLSVFYAEDSVFARFDEGLVKHPEQFTVVGQSEIVKKIQTLGYENCKVAVETFDSQPSINGSFALLVTGRLLLGKDSMTPRPFVQTFVLARASDDEPRYYLKNDILHFLAPPVPPVLPLPPLPSSAVPAEEAKTDARFKEKKEARRRARKEKELRKDSPSPADDSPAPSTPAPASTAATVSSSLDVLEPTPTPAAPPVPINAVAPAHVPKKERPPRRRRSHKTDAERKEAAKSSVVATAALVTTAPASAPSPPVAASTVPATWATKLFNAPAPPPPPLPAPVMPRENGFITSNYRAERGRGGRGGRGRGGRGMGRGRGRGRGAAVTAQ